MLLAFGGVALLLAIVGWLILGDRPEKGEPKSNGEYRALLLGSMFEELEELGYDTSAPLDWKYVFMHREYEPLARLVRELRESGYELVLSDEIREPENQFVEHKVILRRAERHTEDTLAIRNKEFRELAAMRGVDLYDGSWVIDPDNELDEAYGDT
jgi:hypothetical protein